MWARAALAAIGVLVGSLTALADTQAASVRDLGFIEIAKIGSMNSVERLVQETAVNKDRFISIEHLLSYEILVRGYGQIVGVPGAW